MSFNSILQSALKVEETAAIKIRLGKKVLFNGSLNELKDDSVNSVDQELIESYLSGEAEQFSTTLTIESNGDRLFRAERGKGITLDIDREQKQEHEGNRTPPSDTLSASETQKTSTEQPDPFEHIEVEAIILQYLAQQAPGHQAEGFELTHFCDAETLAELIPAIEGLEQEGMLQKVEGDIHPVTGDASTLYQLGDRQRPRLPEAAIPEQGEPTMTTADRLALVLSEVATDHQLEWLIEGIKGLQESPITKMVMDKGAEATQAAVSQTIELGRNSRESAFARSVVYVTETLGRDGVYESEGYTFRKEDDTYGLFQKGNDKAIAKVQGKDNPQTIENNAPIADQCVVISSAVSLRAGIAAKQAVSAYRSTKEAIQTATKIGDDVLDTLQSTVSTLGDISPKGIKNVVERIETHRISQLVEKVTQSINPNRKGQKIFEGKQFTFVKNVKTQASQVFDRATKSPLFSHKQSGQIISRLNKQGRQQISKAFEKIKQTAHENVHGVER